MGSVSAVLLLLVIKGHERVCILSGDRYSEIQTRNRIMNAIGCFTAANIMLVGILDLSRFFLLHMLVAVCAFAGTVVFGFVNHKLYKREVLQPYNDPKMRYWRLVLIWTAAVSCLLMPLALGSVAIRDKSIYKLLQER